MVVIVGSFAIVSYAPKSAAWSFHLEGIDTNNKSLSAWKNKWDTFGQP